MRIGGTEVVFTPDAMRPTAERLFPASKHRSQRIRKKLIKRFGSEFRMEPICFQWPGDRIIYAHPSFKAALIAEMEARNKCATSF